MKKSLLEPRGGHLLPRDLPTEPVAIEQWHVDAARRLAFELPGDLASRLMQAATDMERHANNLAARETALAARRKQLAHAVADWWRINAPERWSPSQLP